MKVKGSAFVKNLNANNAIDSLFMSSIGKIDRFSKIRPVYDQFSETREILSLLKAFLRIKGFKDARILHVAQTESGFVL